MSKELIFVFGSNLQGIHGKGSAQAAYASWGAEWGVGQGRAGYSYAIPTKYTPYKTMPLEEIAPYVNQFLRYAKHHPELIFEVVAIGTGNAGYAHKEIAPLFRGAPVNCKLPREWKIFLV